MKQKIKFYIWLLGALLVLGIVCYNPEYAETAARAVMLLQGNETCALE